MKPMKKKDAFINYYLINPKYPAQIHEKKKYWYLMPTYDIKCDINNNWYIFIFLIQKKLTPRKSTPFKLN